MDAPYPYAVLSDLYNTLIFWVSIYQLKSFEVLCISNREIWKWRNSLEVRSVKDHIPNQEFFLLTCTFTLRFRFLFALVLEMLIKAYLSWIKEKEMQKKNLKR